MNEHNFAFVNAVYRPVSTCRYKDNPFIQALPPLPSDTEIASALTFMPRFDNEERLLSVSTRVELTDVLSAIVFPLPRLVRLARSVITMIRTGYGPRLPFSTRARQSMQELYALQQAGTFVSVAQSQTTSENSMALVATSGCGKSFGLKSIAGLFPTAIFHPDLGVWQLPILIVEMSYDGESVHTLASEIFAALDRLLPDAGYTKDYMNRKGLNAMQRLTLALTLCREHNVGIIIVDEAQNQKSIGNEQLNPSRKRHPKSDMKSETPLTKLLITASNIGKIPLLMAGTPEMQSIVGQRFTRARRMSGNGSAQWRPLERSGNLAKPGEFEMLLRALWRYQWMRNPVELTQEWSDCFFYFTEGIPDIMVKLFKSSQIAAIVSGKETLTPELIKATFDREFSAAAFGIQALRDRDRLLLDVATDLRWPDMIEAAKAARLEFQVPVQPDRPKQPALPPEARPNNDAPKRAAKPAKPGPVAQVISPEVAKAADLRGEPGTTSPVVPDVVDLSKGFPV